MTDRVPTFDGTGDIKIWAARLSKRLEVKGFKSQLQNNRRPADNIDANNVNLNLAAQMEWDKQSEKAVGYIHGCLSDQLSELIDGLDTVQEIMAELKAKFTATPAEEIQKLEEQLDGSSFDGMSAPKV